MSSSNILNNMEWDMDGVSKALSGNLPVVEALNQGVDLLYTEPNQIIGICPDGREINFADSFWDFSHLDHNNRNKSLYRYDFSEIQSTSYRIYMKRMVLREVSMNQNRFSTAYPKYLQVRTFIGFLEKKKYCFIPRLIYPKIIEEYLALFNKKKVRSKYKTCGAISLFLAEIENAEGTLNLREFKSILSIDYEKLRAETENNKTPSIPRSIFNKIVQLALEDLENDNLDTLNKMISCLILIISQIGMRKGESLIIEKNKEVEQTILNGEYSVSYLEFWTYKTTFSKGKWTKSFMTPIALKAYQTLQDITIERRGKGRYLYTDSKGRPYTESIIGDHFKKFFARHQNNLGFSMLNEGEKKLLNKWDIKPNDKRVLGKLLKDYSVGTELYKINPHQFRVFVANELRRQNVPLEWIREHMNHLEVEMTEHYFREDKRQLQIETLKARASKDGSQLETTPEQIPNGFLRTELSDPYFYEAYMTINEFLSENQLNIYNDIEIILETFKKTPIRDNKYGFCTIAFATLCERHESLTTLEKWRFNRLQIADVSSLDFTYRRFTEKLELVKHNKRILTTNQKYRRQYLLELKSLELYSTKKLYPEIMLLKKVIETSDKEIAILKYPNLKNVIVNIEMIEKECLQWMSETKLLET